MLRLYNSLTRKAENFVPVENKKVTIYVCGITPYDTTHLGHAFVYMSFDALIRYLQFRGYEVTYTQNVTDINDRDKDILQRAKEQNVSWCKLADYWTKKFLKDMRDLNWKMPNHYLKASENITEMIDLIERLIKNGFAYQKNGSVYLDISKKKDFGKLSGFNRKKMLEIAKNFDEDIDNPDKKDKLDITLWRSSSKNQPVHIPSFDSSFGKGRPGWHIECSAMSIKTLGEQIDPFDKLRVNGEHYRTIDIHGGGIDLIYPHHEAEIAQSEGATLKSPFVKYWMHVGTVYYKGEKMSKSLGNLVMVSDLLKKYSANAIRFLLLSKKREEKWEFEEKDLIKSEKQISLILKALKQKSKENRDNDKYIKKFISLMDNDIDTPRALKLMIDLAHKSETLPLKTIFSVLGFTL